MESPYETDIKQCVQILKNDGVILYPTDTIWGLGCDAHHEKAIEKIYQIKQRELHKSFVLLMTDVKQLSNYIANPIPDLASIVSQFTQPTTIIYEHAINLPHLLVSNEGSIAVRITKDPFCRALIKRLRSPLVSTSVNKSGEPSAANYNMIQDDIKKEVDYVVHWRQDDSSVAEASTILKLQADGHFIKIR